MATLLAVYLVIPSRILQNQRLASALGWEHLADDHPSPAPLTDSLYGKQSMILNTGFNQLDTLLSSRGQNGGIRCLTTTEREPLTEIPLKNQKSSEARVEGALSWSRTFAFFIVSFCFFFFSPDGTVPFPRFLLFHACRWLGVRDHAVLTQSNRCVMS